MASNYNMSLRPAIVLVKDGEARLVRRRETYEDLLRPEEWGSSVDDLGHVIGQEGAVAILQRAVEDGSRSRTPTCSLGRSTSAARRRRARSHRR